LTLTQIKEFAEGLVQLELDLAKVRDWINEVLEENVLDIKNFTTYTFTGCTAGTWYTLPVACVRVKEVTDIYGSLYYDWQADLGLIKFLHSGTYSVTYYDMATEVTTGGSSPDCHVLFHKPLCYYVAYRAENEDEANDSDGQYFLGEYQAKWSNAKKLLQKRRRRAVAPAYR
jgi:hypothetical protein